MKTTQRLAFSLIELLIVIAIIALLIGILLPSLTMAKKRAVGTGCMSNLKNFAGFMEVYKGEHNELYPIAKYMPSPFLTGSSDPPLTQALASVIDPKRHDAEVYHCGGDETAYALSGSSYAYNSILSGTKVQDIEFLQQLNLQPEQVFVMQDFDGAEVELEDGSTIELPFFHADRNLLFADGHVANVIPE